MYPFALVLHSETFSWSEFTLYPDFLVGWLLFGGLYFLAVGPLRRYFPGSERVPLLKVASFAPRWDTSLPPTVLGRTIPSGPACMTPSRLRNVVALICRMARVSRSRSVPRPDVGAARGDGGRRSRWGPHRGLGDESPADKWARSSEGVRMPGAAA